MGRCRVGVMGAGAIGAYLGVLLSAQGFEVVLVGRPWLVEIGERLAARGISGITHRPTADLIVTTDVGSLSSCDVCLVTVKSQHTASIVDDLRGALPSGALVCSFQNGLRNAAVLREGGLGGAVAGMVSFNVFQDDACFVQATSGPLTLGVPGGASHRELLHDLQRAFDQAGERLDLERDIEAIQAGKLLINLNNGVCALTGLSIAQSLQSRPLRRAFAACTLEGLRIYKAAGIDYRTIGKLHPKLIAKLLPLPDGIVLRVAPSLISIDERARSSTLQDLEVGKKTEIDALNGELVRIAEAEGIDAPINRWVTEEIHRLEAVGVPVPFLEPEVVWAAIEGL